MYQAYNDEIAEAALEAGTFVAPFKRGRMIWLKPSFRWMLYRSGWGRKDITRNGLHANVLSAVDRVAESFAHSFICADHRHGQRPLWHAR